MSETLEARIPKTLLEGFAATVAPIAFEAGALIRAISSAASPLNTKGMSTW